MAFNRVGDNGSVGGQTLVGLTMLRQLLAACREEGIPLRCWPFDGLDITSVTYKDAHVLVEPYPSAARPLGIPQSDEADAIAAVTMIQEHDQKGTLSDLLNLNGLTVAEQQLVQFEGWIVGHTPLAGRRW